MKALADIATAQAAKTIAQTATSHASANVRKYAITLLGYQMMDRTTHALCPETFIAAMKDGDRAVRIEAIRYGWKLPGKAGIKPPLLGLADPDAAVRSAAAEALGKLGTEEAWQALLAAVGKESAPGTLGAIGLSFARRDKTPHCVPGQLAVLQRLIVLRKTPREPGRSDGGARSIIDRLGGAGDKRATGILCRILTTDHEHHWREGAARALGYIRDPASIGALIKALGDEATSVSDSAAFALSGLADKNATKALLEATKDPGTRAGAARVLAVFDPKAAYRPYVEALEANTKDPRAKDLAAAIERSGKKDIVEGLIAALESDATHVHRLAISRLALTRDRRAAGPLWEAVMKGKYPDIRRAASSALEKLRRLGARVGQPRRQAPAR